MGELQNTALDFPPLLVRIGKTSGDIPPLYLLYVILEQRPYFCRTHDFWSSLNHRLSLELIEGQASVT